MDEFTFTFDTCIDGKDHTDARLNLQEYLDSGNVSIENADDWTLEKVNHLPIRPTDKTISLNVYGIHVAIDHKGGGTIVSDLLNLADHDDERTIGAVNALESMILASAVAGIDIESPAFLEVIETVVDAIGNNAD